MPKLSLSEFLTNRNLLALKLASSDLSGLFKKKFVIPKDCVGLALFANGAISLYGEGKEVAGQFDLILAKLGEIQLRYPLADLRSSDGFPIQCTIGLTVAIQTDRPDLFKDFTRTFFNFPGAYSSADLKTALVAEVKKALSAFVSTNRAADLHKRDRFREIEAAVRSSLEHFLFGTGLRLERIIETHFSSAEFAAHAAAEAKREDEERERVARLGRKEEQLRRLAGLLNDASIKEVLAKLPDERLKGLFYAKLMEDDSATLTPHEVAAKINECGDNLSELVYKAMEGLLSGEKAQINPGEIAPEHTETIFIALGSKVVELDPTKPGHPVREFPFKDPLRSIRCVEGPNGPELLVGSKHAIHTVTLSSGECRAYTLPNGREPRGGVNAVAAHGEHIYATHSEYGVARWERQKPDQPGTLVWPELTSKHKTTRAVQTSGEDILFATGNRVYTINLANGAAKPVEYPTGAEGSVTTLAAGGGTLFAGTEDGLVVAWKLGDPTPTVLVRRRESIINLRVAKVCSIPHLFYSAKDLSVRARVIGQNLETSYESGGASVGVLDAASDLIAASDTAGRRMLLWKVTSPARPTSETDIRKLSDKPILDIWIKKIKVP